MTPITGPATASIEVDVGRELAEIEAESIGWQPLGDGAYLHTGSDSGVIEVVGVAHASMVGSNVLWMV